MYRHEADLATTIDEDSMDLCVDGMPTQRLHVAKHGCLQANCDCMVHVSKKGSTCAV